MFDAAKMSARCEVDATISADRSARAKWRLVSLCCTFNGRLPDIHLAGDSSGNESCAIFSHQLDLAFGGLHSLFDLGVCRIYIIDNCLLFARSRRGMGN